MSFFQTELGKLLIFWAFIAVMCGMMVVLVWYFKMGDTHMVRRTSIYFGSIFVVLPLIYILVRQSSPSLANMGFFTFFIIGTAAYFILTAMATFRPRG